MASGNYAKKPVPSTTRDDRTLIPARATRTLSSVTEDSDSEEGITFSRDSASVRPLTTDRMDVPRNRAGNRTTPNTPRTPDPNNITRMPSNPGASKTPTAPKTTKTPKTTNTTNTTTGTRTRSTSGTPKTPTGTRTTNKTDTTKTSTGTSTNTTKTPNGTKTTRTQNNTLTATQTLNRRKAENNTLILPESRGPRPTRALAESQMLTEHATRVLTESSQEHITTVLPETRGGNPTRVLPTTQTIRAVNIDRALTHDVPSPLVELERHQPWLRPWLICFIFAIVCMFVLISAGIFQRPGTSSFYNGGQTYSIQVGGSQSQNWQKAAPAPIKKTIPIATGPYAVLGKPTVTATFINQVLQAHGSPAAGKGQSLYNLGVQYGIDPVFALAFFQHESGFGTAGEATKTRSLGNLRCYTGATCVDTEIGGGYAQYATWEDGFTAWYALIRDYYVNVRGLTTVDLIIPVYAPTADNNDEAEYIASLKGEITNFHNGDVNG